MKKILGIIIFTTFLSLVASACSISRGASGPDSPNTVHMNANAFEKTSITINKGESVNLVNDVPIAHVIANGTWDSNTPKPTNTAGAPKLDNLQIDGNGSDKIGPFNTAGTFQIYCTIHPGMKMTVIVK